MFHDNEGNKGVIPDTFGLQLRSQAGLPFSEYPSSLQTTLPFSSLCSHGSHKHLSKTNCNVSELYHLLLVVQNTGILGLKFKWIKFKCIYQ